jgi:ABC-type Mn2+/Zn2+ transport system ATPase subunit
MTQTSEQEPINAQKLIKVRDAVFGYGGRAVVRVDQLDVERGKCLGIFGPNGAGKTTLNRARVSGRDSLSYGQPGSLRIGYLQQHRGMELHWPMTALDAASLPVSAQRPFGWLSASRTNSVVTMMRRLKIDHLAPRPFADLSGGQQQRVLLAGALACEPTVLVLDEPTDGLDVRSTEELLDLLRQFIAEGVAMMVISHEADDLMQIANDIAWLHPAEQFGDASRVEIVTPQSLAERLVQLARREGSVANAGSLATDDTDKTLL